MNTAYNTSLAIQLSAYTDKPLTAEENEALYPDVAGGNAVARETMILGNTALALANVESFLRQYFQFAYLRDDLMSAAFIGLTKAVNQMAAGCEIKDSKGWTPVGCMGAWINRELSRLIEDERQIRLPHESERLARHKGAPIAMPTVSNMVPERGVSASYEEEVEVRDLIETCLQSDEERMFMVMREAAHTYEEITEVLGTSVPTVSRLAQKLDARLQELVANDGQFPPLLKTVSKDRQQRNRTYYLTHQDAILARKDAQRNGQQE